MVERRTFLPGGGCRVSVVPAIGGVIIENYQRE